MAESPSFHLQKVKIGSFDARMRWGAAHLKLSTPSDVISEKEEQLSPQSLRLVRMGAITDESKQKGNEIFSTPEEIEKATNTMKHITSIARCGWQIPAYTVVRQSEPTEKNIGQFTGYVFAGVQDQLRIISRIPSTMEDIKVVQELKDKFPNTDFFHWFQNVIDLNSDTKLSDLLYNANSRDVKQRMIIFHTIQKNPEGALLVLSMPAYDTNCYGRPPYSDHTDRPAKSLTYIQFDNAESRKTFEKVLLSSYHPLRVWNAINTVLFSPDVCTNLLIPDSGTKFLIKDGQPQKPYYQDTNKALGDMAGLGFDLPTSDRYQGNETPFIR